MEPDYKKLDYQQSEHHQRYKVFVGKMPRKLLCQDCGGVGHWVEVVLEDGSGPTYSCSWCEGTGLVTSHLRRLWLRWKRIEKEQAIRQNPKNISRYKHSTAKIQEWVIKQRPDLIGRIPNLKPKLKVKYQHELELGKVDL
jgi:hypothetical protein